MAIHSNRWQLVPASLLAGAWLVAACGGGDSGAAARGDSSAKAAGDAKGSASASTSTAPAASGSAAPAASGAAPAKAAGVATKPATPRDITGSAVIDASASSSQGCHQPAAAFDSWPTTAWTEDSPEDGTGEWIEAKLAAGTWVDYLEVGGGWFGKASSDVVDLWEHNNSFRTMKITWDGGEATVEFNRLADRGRRKRVPVGKNISAFKITAVAADKGRFNDLCVDDVYVFGALASPPADGPDAACADASPADCPDGLFMKLPGVALPRVAREKVDLLAADRALFGVQMLSDRKAGPGILVRNACQAAKVKGILGAEVGDAVCQPLEPATYLQVVTAKNACDRYAACVCGLAYGLDGDAEASGLCDSARGMVSGRENAKCDQSLTNLKEFLNRVREIKPDLKMPCECQN